MLDLVIRHGTFATASDTFECDIGVADGVIVTLARDLPDGSGPTGMTKTAVTVRIAGSSSNAVRHQWLTHASFTNGIAAMISSTGRQSAKKRFITSSDASCKCCIRPRAAVASLPTTT
jgi:hypothetical protein